MTLPSEVPKTKRALQAFFFAPLFCLTISGVVFGFAGIPPMVSERRLVADKGMYSIEADTYKRGDISQLLYG